MITLRFWLEHDIFRQDLYYFPKNSSPTECASHRSILFKIPTLVMNRRTSMVSHTEGLFSPVSDPSQKQGFGEKRKKEVSTEGYFFRVASQLAVICVSGACGFEMIPGWVPESSFSVVSAATPEALALLEGCSGLSGGGGERF